MKSLLTGRKGKKGEFWGIPESLARPNSPDMPPKRSKKVRFGIITVVIISQSVIWIVTSASPPLCPGRERCVRSQSNGCEGNYNAWR